MNLRWLLPLLALGVIGCSRKAEVKPAESKSTQSKNSPVVANESEFDPRETSFTDSQGNKTTIMAGTSEDFKKTGLIPYPNTFEVKGKSAVTEMNSEGAKGYTAMVYSKDSMEEVAEHFKKQFLKLQNETKSDHLILLSGSIKGNLDATIMIMPEKEGTQISVIAGHKS